MKDTITAAAEQARAVDPNAAPDPATAKPEEVVKHLAGLSPLEYDKVRESTAEAMGVRVTTLDKEVAKVRKVAEVEAEGGKLTITDPEPWPEPVDGAELLNDMTAIVRRYCVLPEGGAEAAALWSLHSYCLDQLFTSPMLYPWSPEPRCGKTTLMNTLSILVKRPLAASSITPAALFRAVEKWQPTLLIDEADTFMRGS